MTSSSIPAARSQYLLDLLAQVPDPRKRRGRRHPLAGLLAVGIAAVIAGSKSFAAIGQWAADAGTDVLAGLGAARGPAEESTFRCAFAMISADLLDQVLGTWLWTRSVQVSGRLVIAVDGKAVRGAKGRDGQAPHLVAALAHGIGAVLGQAAVTAKSNEIPAVRDLLKAFTDLAGAVITIDALCRRPIGDVTPDEPSHRIVPAREAAECSLLVHLIDRPVLAPAVPIRGSVLQASPFTHSPSVRRVAFLAEASRRLEQGELQEFRLDSCCPGRLCHPAEVDRVTVWRPCQR
jgi:hypothetical protein